MAIKTVLLVEDNEKLNAINRRALEGEGHKVLTALTLSQAREHLVVNDPEVILLDVLLPDGNGIDFCGEIRGDTDAHILFLTSRTEHEDRIRGLDTGGDDYITKPYKLEEMLSRVRSAMRRRNMDAVKPLPLTLTRGPLTLNTVAAQAFLNGEDMLLSPKEFSLLLLLVQNEGKTLSKEILYETAWNAPMAGDGNALWKQMSTMKKKLGKGGRAVSLTASRGDGYMLEIKL
jgi:DNA-binding response OmpR family regulator